MLTYLAPDEAKRGFAQLWWRAFAFHLFARDFLAYLHRDAPMRLVLAGLVVFALAVSLHRAYQQEARWILAAAVSLKLWLMFPENSNHFFVEFVVAWLCALAKVSRTDQRRTLIAALRWLLVIVFFHSGLQKLLHGTYFHGTFLATRITEARFAWFLALILPHEEFVAIQRLMQVGASGPFMFRSWPALLVSNAIYLGEMSAAVLLALPRTRTFGVLSLLGICLAIEVVAREALFGLLVLHLSALFMSPRFARRAVYVGLLGEAGLVVAQMHLGGTVRFFN